MSGPGPVNAVRNLIDQHGWAVIGVFPTSVDDGPPFSYTVGMTDRGLPELAVYGLDPRSAAGVLNAVAGHVLTAGELPRGKAIDGLLAGGAAAGRDHDGRHQRPIERAGALRRSDGSATDRLARQERVNALAAMGSR